jgi:hypothetical protein
MGDVIREEVQNRGLPRQTRVWGLWHGASGAVRDGCDRSGVYPVINRQQADVVLVDAYGDAEVTLFSKTYPEFSLVSIEHRLQSGLQDYQSGVARMT